MPRRPVIVTIVAPDTKGLEPTVPRRPPTSERPSQKRN
jgi:hypothetical protein